LELYSNDYETITQHTAFHIPKHYMNIAHIKTSN